MTKAEEILKIKILAKETINQCKDKCYSYGREAGNDLEGDYGSWRQWENVLIKFGKQLLSQTTPNL